MKTVFLKEVTRLVSIVNQNSSKLDFYIVFSDNQRVYAFSRRFKNSVYSFTKNGVRINRLIVLRSEDKDIMNLVGHLKRNLPFLVEEYDLQARIA